MSVEELALGLPRIDKLRLTGTLWADLASQSGEFDSPSWHEAALKETEQRLKDGSETVIEWADAKKQMRDGR